MDVDEMIRLAEEADEAYCGFSIFRDGEEYPLTVGEATEATERLLAFTGRLMAVTLLREYKDMSLPAAVLDDMAARYADRMMDEIPMMLNKLVREDLKIEG